MTKNRALDDAMYSHARLVSEAIASFKISDRARLALAMEPEIDRENGIHVAVRQNDEGTPERQAKGDLYTEESDTISHKRSVNRAPLDKYRSEGALGRGDKDMNYRLWKAGHTLRQSFRAAKFGGQRITANLLSAGGGGAGLAEMTDEASDAYGALKAAMEAAGPLSAVLAHVVCLELTVSSWAEKYGWKNQKSDGMAALRLALDALARHYRI